MADSPALLVVDDDDVTHECVQRSLRRLDAACTVVPARDGLEALAILRGEHAERSISRPLIVLLDLNMPRMNGHEFLAALRDDEALRDEAVYVLTSSGRAEDRSAAEAQGVVGFLEKTGRGTLTEQLGAMLS